MYTPLSIRLHSRVLNELSTRATLLVPLSSYRECARKVIILIHRGRRSGRVESNAAQSGSIGTVNRKIVLLRATVLSSVKEGSGTEREAAAFQERIISFRRRRDDVSMEPRYQLTTLQSVTAQKTGF